MIKNGEFAVKKENLKLERENPYKAFKVKPWVIVVALSVGIAAGGITVGSIIGSNAGKGNMTIDTPSTVSATTPVVTSDSTKITSVNKYRLNIKDFDEVISGPFLSNDENVDTYAIKDVKADSDVYSFVTSNGETIVSSIDNVILADTDFERRQKTDSLEELSSFMNVFVKQDNKIESLATDFVSLEDINNENLFLVDTAEKRLLLSTDKCLPYRKMDVSRPTSKYANPDQYIDAYCYIDGLLVRFDEFIGYREIKIGNDNFIIICSLQEDGGIYEYLTTKDNCIFVRFAKSLNEVVPGTKLSYTGATGNISMQYKKAINFYRNIKNVVLGEDGQYYVTVECLPSEAQSKDTYLLFTIPPKCYSFAFEKEPSLNSLGNDTIDLNGYNMGFYNQYCFGSPLLTSGGTLTKIDDEYFYLLNKTADITNKEEKPGNGTASISRSTKSVYEVHSVALGRRIVNKDIINDYPLIEEPIDFIFNMGGNFFSDGLSINGSECKYLTYKGINLLGLDYYSIILKYNNALNQPEYFEIIAPKTCVIVKGSEQDIEKQVVLKK